MYNADKWRRWSQACSEKLRMLVVAIRLME